MTRPRCRGMLGSMRSRAWLGSLSLGCALLVAGCNSGTETGNPSLTGALSYTGYSSAPEQYGVREGGTIATLERAWLDLDTVSISQSGACGLDGGEKLELPALGVGDHAAGNHNSTPYTTRAGSFCSVELPFKRVPTDSMMSGLPAELRGQSLLLEGKLADGTPFSIASASTPVVQLSAEGAGFTLTEGEADALLAFDFATWLSAIDFAAAERSGDRIEISASSNGELLAALEAKLAAGVALYRDRDADGQLDSDAELLAHAP